jgi:quinol monooxygenase YgiN
MELTIFARFHACSGQEAAVADTLRRQAAIVRPEPGCLAIQVFGSVRDPRMFYLHSRWTNETAFDVHAELPTTQRFLERIQPLIDHPLDVTRARPLE